MKEELIVSLTADIKDLSSKLDKANTEIIGFADKSAASTNKAANSFKGLGSELQNLVVGYISLQAATEAVGRAFSESIKLDSVKSALTQVLGSSELAVAQLDRLSQSADYLGLNFLDLATSYKSFAAAAISSGQTLESTNKIFDSVTKSAAVLKLSSEDVKLSLNALGQMFSKGSIQSEELRGQLGERLPGAVALLAKGLGVSTKELNKMLEQGQVLASDLPKLADELDKTYGDSITKKVNTLQSSVNELSNTFTKSLSSGAVGNFFKVIVDGANRALSSIEYLYKLLSNKPGTNIAAVGFEEDFKKYQELSKKGLAKIDVNADQKKIATQQGEINSALEQNIKLTADATILYGNQSSQVVTLNKEYGWLVNQLTEVNKLIKVKPTIPTILVNGSIAKAEADLKALNLERNNTKVGSNKYLELSKSIDIATKSLEKLQLQELKIKLGDTPKFNLDNADPFANVDLSKLKEATKEVNDLQASMNLLLINSLQLQQIGGEIFTPINNGVVITNEEVVKVNENAMSLVSTLGNTLTSAFDAALISGENFGVILVKAIGDLIKKMLAAITTAAILSAILSSFGVGAVAIGGKEGVSLFGTILKNLTGFGGGGKPSGNRVISGVTTSSNSGTVAFEIRGDKLYGVLQNYQGRLDRLV